MGSGARVLSSAYEAPAIDLMDTVCSAYEAPAINLLDTVCSAFEAAAINLLDTVCSAYEAAAIDLLAVAPCTFPGLLSGDGLMVTRPVSAVWVLLCSQLLSVVSGCP